MFSFIMPIREDVEAHSLAAVIYNAYNGEQMDLY